MKQLCFRIAAAGRLVAADPDTAVDLAMSGDGSFWLDVDGGDDDMLDGFMRRAGLNEGVREICLEERDLPRLIPGARGSFIQFPTYSSVNDDSIVYLALLCLPGLLITFHKEPVETLATLSTRFQSNGTAYLTGTSGLVCVLLWSLSSLAMRKMVLARRRVDELTAIMDRDPEAVEWSQILDAKAAALVLDTIASESAQIISSVRYSRTDALNLAEFESVYEVVITNTEFLAKSIDHHWRHLTELHQRYILNLQEKGNRRLTFLTVASAIFLPLTLLTGIYGMNFEHMPGLKSGYGYEVLLLIMVLLAFGLWIYFKRKGWFE